MIMRAVEMIPRTGWTFTNAKELVETTYGRNKS